MVLRFIVFVIDCLVMFFASPAWLCESVLDGLTYGRSDGQRGTRAWKL